MRELRRLPGHCLDPFGVGKAEGVDPDSASEIDVGLAVYIFTGRTPAALDADVEAVVGVQDILLILLLDFLEIHAAHSLFKEGADALV